MKLVRRRRTVFGRDDHVIRREYRRFNVGRGTVVSQAAVRRRWEEVGDRVSRRRLLAVGLQTTLIIRHADDDGVRFPDRRLRRDVQEGICSVIDDRYDVGRRRVNVRRRRHVYRAGIPVVRVEFIDASAVRRLVVVFGTIRRAVATRTARADTVRYVEANILVSFIGIPYKLPPIPDRRPRHFLLLLLEEEIVVVVAVDFIRHCVFFLARFFARWDVHSRQNALLQRDQLLGHVLHGGVDGVQLLVEFDVERFDFAAQFLLDLAEICKRQKRAVISFEISFASNVST